MWYFNEPKIKVNKKTFPHKFYFCMQILKRTVKWRNLLWKYGSKRQTKEKIYNSDDVLLIIIFGNVKGAEHFSKIWQTIWRFKIVFSIFSQRRPLVKSFVKFPDLFDYFYHIKQWLMWFEIRDSHILWWQPGFT